VSFRFIEDRRLFISNSAALTAMSAGFSGCWSTATIDDVLVFLDIRRCTSSSSLVHDFRFSSEDDSLTLSGVRSSAFSSSSVSRTSMSSTSPSSSSGPRPARSSSFLDAEPPFLELFPAVVLVYADRYDRLVAGAAFPELRQRSIVFEVAQLTAARPTTSTGRTESAESGTGRV
jgi:hypothetical protein